MKLKYTILYVNNVKQSLEFYRDAFGFHILFLHESEDYGELDTGSTRLGFSSIELMEKLGKSPASPDPSSPSFEVAFETSDVIKAFNTAIAAGAVPVQQVRDEAWGQTTSYVNDINGFLIEICSPVQSQA